MSICATCGVEIGEAERCPLCLTAREGPAAEPASQAPQAPQAPQEPEPHFSLSQRRRFIVEVSGVSGFIAGAAALFINLFTEGKIGWSLYPLACLAFCWVMTAAAVYVEKRKAIAIPILCLAPPAFLLSLDAIDGSLSWALPFGCPLAFFAEASIAAVVLSARLSKRRGLNVIAYALLAATAICLAIEILTGFLRKGGIVLYWSNIVAAALIPVAVFLLYAHYRLWTKSTLRKLFRL